MIIRTQYRSPFVEVEFIYKGKKLGLINFLVDTGSASTLIAAEIAVQLGLGPEPDDVIREVTGIGGTAFVYEKHIDRIQLDSKDIENFSIQVGDMDYGFEMDGILVFDCLIAYGVQGTVDYSLFHKDIVADNADVDSAATRILAKHIKAFEELAK